jgi:hypothetical protein
MGLMVAARDAPHDEILVESCTSRHRFQSGLLLWCLCMIHSQMRSLAQQQNTVVRVLFVTGDTPGRSAACLLPYQFPILCLDCCDVRSGGVGSWGR